MEIGHVILGRSCQYNHKHIHDGYTNKITFTYQGGKMVLLPLTA